MESQMVRGQYVMLPNPRLQPTPAKFTRGQALAKAQRENNGLRF
jgi:hypothetical protein